MLNLGMYPAASELSLGVQDGGLCRALDQSSGPLLSRQRLPAGAGHPGPALRRALQPPVRPPAVCALPFPLAKVLGGKCRHLLVFGEALGLTQAEIM